MLHLAAACALTFAAAQDAQAADELLEAARETARWIGAQRIETEHGITWPIDPEQPESRATNLYSGSPGVVLFLLELARASGEERWRQEALLGVQELIAQVPRALTPQMLSQGQAGLWTGCAGLAFVLECAARLAAGEEAKAAAVQCLEVLHAAAQESGKGRSLGPVTDVIAGNAGIGFLLLHTAEVLERPQDLELACALGRHLIEVATKTEHGLDWAMSATYERRMPNFSHGTAGVATFLAALHRKTGAAEFKSAALAGGQHLLAIAERADGGMLIQHHAPGGEQLFYLGFCHGPTGTARLFRALDTLSADPLWKRSERECAVAIHASGIPAKRTPGFWNNVGPCCGSAGVAEYLLERYRLSGEAADLALVQELTRDLLARGTRDEQGLRWVHAEHRVRPELLQAQTGYMQGAAGIGLWLLRQRAYVRDVAAPVRFPDDCF